MLFTFGQILRYSPIGRPYRMQVTFWSILLLQTFLSDAPQQGGGLGGHPVRGAEGSDWKADAEAAQLYV